MNPLRRLPTKVSRSVLGAVLIAALLAGWLVSGETSSQPPSPAVDPSSLPVDESLRVTTQIMSSGPIENELVLRGQLEPLREVVLRAETDGRVNRVPAQKGDLLKKGATIIELSLNAREARRAEAAALVEQRRVSQLAAQGLYDQGVQSSSVVILKKAELAAAEAALARVEIEMEQTVVRAPFNGILNDRRVEVGDFVDRGDRIGTIVDISKVLMTAQVPQQEIASLAIGQNCKGRLLSGETLVGKIRYLSAVAELDTRSFRIEVEVPNPDAKLALGSSVDILLPIATSDGHCLPASLLTIMTDGTTGVRLVGTDRIVRLQRVEVVTADPKGICITGLPARAEVITSGQGLVLSGQRILDDGTVAEVSAVAAAELSN